MLVNCTRVTREQLSSDLRATRVLDMHVYVSGLRVEGDYQV